MELEGKIINFLGDSITEGVGVTNLNNRYDNRLKRQLHLKGVYNYGIGGTRLAHQSTPSEKPRHDLCFCGRAYDLNPNADITLVYGGVNDYIHGDAPFGNLTDATPRYLLRGGRFFNAPVKNALPRANGCLFNAGSVKPQRAKWQNAL